MGATYRFSFIKMNKCLSCIVREDTNIFVNFLRRKKDNFQVTVRIVV